MKKFFLFIAISLAAFAANAAGYSALQYLNMDFSQSPNGYIYDGWTCWGIGKTPTADVTENFYFTEDMPPYIILYVDNEAVAFSNSTTVEGGAVDEWLVSPMFNIPVDDFVITFDVFAYGNRRDSKYELYVSTTGNTAADFESLEPVYSGKLRGSTDYVEMTSVQVPLSGYKDQDICIALVNKSTNAYITGFSNIIVGEYAVSLTNSTESYVYEAGEYPVSVTADLLTAQECAGFTAKLEASNGLVSEYVETKDLSQRYTTYSFEFPDPIVFTQKEDVTYTITLTPNYEGATPLVMEYSIIYTDGYPYVVVMEEATGAWCGYCPLGAAALEKFSDDHGDQFIGIAVHQGDGMQVNDYWVELSPWIAGFPQAVINRQVVTTPYDEATVNALIAKKSPIKVDILSADFDSETGKATVKYAPMFGYSATNQNLGAAVVVLEDGCTGRGSNWVQSNYLSSASTGISSAAGWGLSTKWQSYLQDFFDAGSSINGYEFNHVAWGIFNDYYGMTSMLAKDWEAGVAQEYSLTFDIPAKIQNIDNTSVVVLIINQTTGEIVTGKKMKTGDTSVSAVEKTDYYAVAQDGTSLVVKAEAGAKVDVYTTDGMCVASEVMVSDVVTINGGNFSGMLLVRITKGNDATVSKLIWQ